MTEPKVTSITVGASIGGSVQIIKYEYTETYSVRRSYTYSGNWTQEQADDFYEEHQARVYAMVSAQAQAEVDRLESMRDRMNGLDG